MQNTGNVNAHRDINSRDIITGLKIDNLTIVMNSLADLGRLIEQGESSFQLTDNDILEIVQAGQSSLILTPDLLKAYKQLSQATDLSLADRQRAYAGWLFTRRPHRPPQRVAAREHFINLSGHYSWDWEQNSLEPHFSWLRPVGEGPERRIEREQIEDVTQAVQKFSAFVLLGPPGSGKSTILERLVYTAAGDYLAERSQRLPLLVTLANYRWERQQPLEFVRDNWVRLVAGDFMELVRSGQILLLVDGLNEMVRLEKGEERSHRAATWQSFFDDYFAEESLSSSRVVIASRDGDDYEQRLGLARVETETLNATQIERFAGAYLAEQATPFLAAVEKMKLQQQANNPFSLYILTQLYDPASSDLPPNRGQLFAAYAARLLGLIYKLDDRALQAGLLALAHLGYQMQLQSESTILPYERLQALLPERVQVGQKSVRIDTGHLFEQVCRIGLLVPDPSASDIGAYKFSHQLLQEQFAAHHLLVRWQSRVEVTDLWAAPRTPQEMPEPEIGEWDPLPPPPTTGWEQTTILAAGMLGAADSFIEAVLAVNPALAGRCVSEGQATISAETRSTVQQTLVATLSNPTLHRRTRIQAGQILAAVGDPRFEPVMVDEVEVILPDLVEVPGGMATIGSDDEQAYDDEQPIHQVEIASFYLGRYPVTNAEYGCFMKAGGYDTEAYWTPTGWQWRQGELEENGPITQILENYRYFFQHRGAIEQAVKDGLLRPEQADIWRNIIQLSEEEVRQQYAEIYAPQAHEQPFYWDDLAYNGANQPVVGVTWYEAMAYCVWLNERLSGSEEMMRLLASGERQVRLPGEVEWEWAASGPKQTIYPWGKEFEVDKANTLAGRILGPTPVGAYPMGASLCGALDMSGNVYEWTYSLYQDYPKRPAKFQKSCGVGFPT